MKRGMVFVALGLLLFARAAGEEPTRDWTNYVRIAAYGLSSAHAEEIVRDAQAAHVFGIEVDNDIPGRYESFLDPTLKLEAIRAVATAAHQAGNRAFVYIAGTECITAHADRVPHSVMKDHPDWVQRNLEGQPGLFNAKAAFWIREGDEDVWISPYAKEWRKTYMERVRQIAGTGIDGIYVDIPYWMTHFEGWENTWASFDDWTVSAFREKTGLYARKDLKLGDFGDANFRKSVDFRIATMTEFLEEIRTNARSVNPAVKVIPEIYPGIEEEATRVGADVYRLYGVVDAIAHEYEFGNGEHMAASRTEADWFLYQAGMLSFRAFGGGKATWILNYSWDGDKGVDKRDAMKNLAMSIVMAGANFWDAQGHEMARSNDPPTRKEIFEWIEKNEQELYLPRLPMHPVGVYFSPKSRDYAAKTFLPSYRGALVVLLQAHRELQVVTPRTLSAFHGECLVLPSVSVLDDSERKSLADFVEGGGRLVVLGRDAAKITAPNVALLREDPASQYYAALLRDFSSAHLPEEFLRAAETRGEIALEAPPTVAANFGLVNGRAQIFLANFGGLVPSKVAVPEPARGIRVKIPRTMGDSLTFLPFLGEKQVLKGEGRDGQVEFVLPAVERGAVVRVGGD